MHPVNEGTLRDQEQIADVLARLRKDKSGQIVLLTTTSPAYYRKHFKFISLRSFGPKKSRLMALNQR